MLKAQRQDDSGNDEPAAVMSLSIRQFYICTWTAACLLGMVVIALIFVMQRIRDEVDFDNAPSRTNNLMSQLPNIYSVQLNQTETLGMTKSSAMVMCFVYAGLAWMMSNGLVLNPRFKKKRASEK